mgnify:CR=1 FL=1
MTLPEAFQQIRKALATANVAYAICGSWASALHGEPRHTNDIDFVTNLDGQNVRPFLEALGNGFYFDLESAQDALSRGRPFNVIHQKLGYKFDFFPVVDPHGDAELDRRIAVALPGLDAELVPVITAEDTILSKLRWYRQGGEVSERQLRDISGMIATSGEKLDRGYLERWAQAMGLAELYHRVTDKKL